jgi:hypothetical protein
MEDTRFELRLSRERRREFAELADRCGLSSADLVRLSVRRLLDNPGMLLEQAAAERVSRQSGQTDEQSRAKLKMVDMKRRGLLQDGGWKRSWRRQLTGEGGHRQPPLGLGRRLSWRGLPSLVPCGPYPDQPHPD